MYPVKFEGANVEIGKQQTEIYKPLPAYADPLDPEGPVVTYWDFTPEERAQILKGETIRVTVLTFNRPIMPMMIEVGLPSL